MNNDRKHECQWVNKGVESCVIRYIHAAAVLIMVAALSCPAAASDQVVEIVSEKLVVDSADNTAAFSGDVIVKHGSLFLRCETLNASYDAEGHPAKIVAAGNVKLSRGELFASAGKAVYDSKTEIIELTGQPVVTRGKQRLAGQRVRINLALDEIEIDKPRGTIALPKDVADQLGGTP